MKDITIRKGKPADLPAVHRLVTELAIFEKAPDQVETSPEQYLKDGFGDKPLFEFFVAEHAADGIIGIAFFYFGYSTWKGKKIYLDDLVITQSWRRKGIGMQLFNRLVAYAVSQEVRQLRWHVLDWNEPAIGMYKKIGAELDPEWITCRFTRPQMIKWMENKR